MADVTPPSGTRLWGYRNRVDAARETRWARACSTGRAKTARWPGWTWTTGAPSAVMTWLMVNRALILMNSALGKLRREPVAPGQPYRPMGPLRK